MAGRLVFLLALTAAFSYGGVSAASGKPPPSARGGPTASSDLRISLFGSNPTAPNTVGFGFHVANAGPARALDVRVTVSHSLALSAVSQGRFPSTTSYGSTTPLPGFPCRLTGPTSYECALGDLKPDPGTSFIVDVTFVGPGTSETRAHVSAGTFDPRPANNDVATSVTVSAEGSGATTGPTGAAPPVAPGEQASPGVRAALLSARLVRVESGRALMVRVRATSATAKLRITLFARSGKVLSRVIRTVPTGRETQIRKLVIGEAVKSVGVALL